MVERVALQLVAVPESVEVVGLDASGVVWLEPGQTISLKDYVMRKTGPTPWTAQVRIDEGRGGCLLMRSHDESFLRVNGRPVHWGRRLAHGDHIDLDFGLRFRVFSEKYGSVQQPDENIRPDLLEGAVGDPLTEDGYLVYADWLTSRSDPLGEWINLHAALENAPRESERHLAAARRIAELDATHSGLALHLGEHHPNVSVGRILGVIRSANVRVRDRLADQSDLYALLDDVLTPRVSMFLSTLKLEGDRGGISQVGLERLSALKQPVGLRFLSIAQRSWSGLDVRDLPKAFPRLLELRLQGSTFDLGRSRWPHLRELRLWMTHWSPAHVRDLMDSELAALHKLVLVADAEHPDVRAILDIFDATNLTVLRELQLGLPNLGTLVCQRLLKSDLLPQLEQVKLSHLSDDAVDLLADHQDALEHLHRISLFGGELSESGKELARRISSAVSV